MAAGRVSMKEPVCLIESDDDGKLLVVRSALDILDKIDQPVVVVAVVGLYRTGKSYLMNKLAGKRKGFALGSTIQSKTKGIWMWCVPHPKKADHTLVLLDTEGLGDVEKGDDKNDNWIFAMAVLLSSTLVYNSMGTIDNMALEKLNYVTELTEHIKIKSNADDYDEDEDFQYVRFFPSFVWSVRDFTLELMIDDKPITSDEYLENALKLKTGQSRKIQQYNAPRSCLRNYFSPRWCFVFERPTHGEKMKRMEELTDEDLEPAFVEQARKFTDHIYTHSDTKTLRGGMEVTGRMFGNLANTYVEAIRSGQVPCIDNAVEALSKIENSKAVDQAKDHYLERMASLVKYPTETQAQLSASHSSSEKEALDLFLKHSFKDNDRSYQLKLNEILQEEYGKIIEKNMLESKSASESIIRSTFEPLENRVSSGYYTTPGGYMKFCNDLQMMTAAYRQTKGKGLMAEEVLRVYLDAQTKTGKTILAADESLTEAQRKAKVEEAKRKESEREAQVMQERLSIQQKLLEDGRRTNEENMKRLMEKMEKDQSEARARHEKLLQEKDKEMQDLRQKGYEEETRRLQEQIDSLKNVRREEVVEEESVMSKTLDTVGTGLMFFPGIGTAAGIGMKFLSRWF